MIRWLANNTPCVVISFQIGREARVKMSWRLRMFWEGLCRGTRFGAIVGLVIAIAINVLSLGLIIAVPEMRVRFLAEYDTPSKAFYNIGSACGGSGLVVIYGAMTGAVIMGIAGCLRGLPPKLSDEEST